jgi:hypothetical protein
MLNRTVVLRLRNPVPDDTKAFYSWFSGQAYRQERTIPGGFPAIRMFPVYGKRWITGKTIFVFMSGVSVFGAWLKHERTRYNYEMDHEWYERQSVHLPYQTAETNLRHLISAYKRHRYEQDLLLDKGYVGLTSEFRKFFYHDDVWRPALHDVIRHPYLKFGGPMLSYNWAWGYW